MPPNTHNEDTKEDEPTIKMDTPTPADDTPLITTAFKPWEPDWDDVVVQLLLQEPEPTPYPLNVVTREEREVIIEPSVSLLCHWVKIQRWE